jgi:hypothetical protein
MPVRHVQNVPPSACVRPRSARWNACECTFAKPGNTMPRNTCAPAGAFSTMDTSAIRPSSTWISTPAVAPLSGNHACSHQ